MIHIRADKDGKIEVISQLSIYDKTCEIDELPDDFMFYLKYGKYRANQDGLYIVDGWVDFPQTKIDWINDNKGCETYEGYLFFIENGINTSITNVEYDWNNEKAYITIADTNFPGPHEFDCITTWTEQDCIDAINSKFK